MPGLTSYIHVKGLKAGIYTGPGPLTCAQYTAAWQHEETDARTFAEWGYDLLKYDWCSYGKLVKPVTREDFTKPYVLMGSLLKKQNRDIQFNLCQYGMGNVWEWGAEVGGNPGAPRAISVLRRYATSQVFYSIAFKNMVLSDYAGPGRWNDPDYILIGTIGTPAASAIRRNRHLSPPGSSTATCRCGR